MNWPILTAVADEAVEDEHRGGAVARLAGDVDLVLSALAAIPVAREPAGSLQIAATLFVAVLIFVTDAVPEFST